MVCLVAFIRSGPAQSADVINSIDVPQRVLRRLMDTTTNKSPGSLAPALLPMIPATRRKHALLTVTESDPGGVHNCNLPLGARGLQFAESNPGRSTAFSLSAT